MVKKDDRVRNWTFIIYPESAPNNWVEVISEERTPFCVSPIHDLDYDMDTNKQTGELTRVLKKAHYHVLVTYSGKKSFEQMKELTDRLEATVPQKVNNCKGIVRYMAHLDNPEKVLYKKSEIIGYVGFDVDSYLISSTDKKMISKEITRYIIANDVDEYIDLLAYALDNNEEWYDYIDTHSISVNTAIRSQRHKSLKARENSMKI